MNSLITTDVKMTSLDIAEVTRKQHKHVLADIRKEIEELGEEISQPIFRPSIHINRGKKYPSYEFGKDGAMQLALKYDAKTRYLVIKKIEELEGQPKVLTEKEQLKASMRLSLETSEDVEELKKDVTYLKGNMRIDSLQQQDLQKTARLTVVKALGGKDTPAYNELSKKVFPALWNEFKDYFKVPRYPDLPKVKYDEALRFVKVWSPPTAMQFKIDACNR